MIKSVPTCSESMKAVPLFRDANLALLQTGYLRVPGVSRPKRRMERKRRLVRQNASTTHVSRCDDVQKCAARHRSPPRQSPALIAEQLVRGQKPRCRRSLDQTSQAVLTGRVLVSSGELRFLQEEQIRRDCSSAVRQSFRDPLRRPAAVRRVNSLCSRDTESDLDYRQCPHRREL